jgi:hypothetical protein
MFAVLIDEESMFPRVIPQLGIYAVHPILDYRIHGGYMKPDLESIGVTAKELLHNLPIGARSRRPALIGGGVAVNLDNQWKTKVPFLCSAQELLARRERV